MKTLQEREWIRIVGHRDVPGRPAMYATTRLFLDYFNLTNLDELPSLAEIRDLDEINRELDLKSEEALQELIEEISTILMEEDKYDLHQWERKNIYPKNKHSGIAQLVSETILTLRCYLIKKRIFKLQQGTEEKVNGDNEETLEEIVNYLHLNKLLNKKLNRVLS